MSNKHRTILLCAAFVAGCSFFALSASAGTYQADAIEEEDVLAVTCEGSLSPTQSGRADVASCPADATASSTPAFSFQAAEASRGGTQKRLPQCSCTYCEANPNVDCAVRGLGIGPCGFYLYVFCDPSLANGEQRAALCTRPDMGLTSPELGPAAVHPVAPTRDQQD